jgi:hypothetical protein
VFVCGARALLTLSELPPKGAAGKSDAVPVPETVPVASLLDGGRTASASTLEGLMWSAALTHAARPVVISVCCEVVAALTRVRMRQAASGTLELASLHKAGLVPRATRFVASSLAKALSQIGWDALAPTPAPAAAAAPAPSADTTPAAAAWHDPGPSTDVVIAALSAAQFVVMLQVITWQLTAEAKPLPPGKGVVDTTGWGHAPAPAAQPPPLALVTPADLHSLVVQVQPYPLMGLSADLTCTRSPCRPTPRALVGVFLDARGCDATRVVSRHRAGAPRDLGERGLRPPRLHGPDGA